MNKLTALIEAAKAATPGPWSYAFPYVRTDRTGWKVANVASTMGDANLEADNAKFIALANPATILELGALLEKAEDALEETTALCTNYEAVEEPDGYQFTEAPAVIKQGNEALAAIKQWKEKADAIRGMEKST